MRKTFALLFLFALSGSAFCEPTLLKGSPVCNTIDAARAAGLLAGGGYRVLPKDCVRAGRSMPISRMDWHRKGQTAMLTIEAPGQTLFVWAPRTSIGYPTVTAKNTTKLRLATLD